MCTWELVMDKNAEKLSESVINHNHNHNHTARDTELSCCGSELWLTLHCRQTTAAEKHRELDYVCRALWLRGRALDSQLREPGFKSCAVVLKPWSSFFTLHCSSSLSYINEYLAIDNGGYVYEQSSCIKCSIWLDVSQRSWRWCLNEQVCQGSKV